MDPKCQATKADGRKCRNKVQSGQSRCWSHDQAQRGGMGLLTSSDKDHSQKVAYLIDQVLEHTVGKVYSRYLNLGALEEDLIPLATEAVELGYKYHALLGGHDLVARANIKRRIHRTCLGMVKIVIPYAKIEEQKDIADQINEAEYLGGNN